MPPPTQHQGPNFAPETELHARLKTVEDTIKELQEQVKGLEQTATGSASQHKAEIVSEVQKIFDVKFSAFQHSHTGSLQSSTDTIIKASAQHWHKLETSTTAEFRRMDSKMDSEARKLDGELKKMNEGMMSEFRKMDGEFRKMDSKIDSEFRKIDSIIFNEIRKIDMRLVQFAFVLGLLCVVVAGSAPPDSLFGKAVAGMAGKLLGGG